MNEFKVGDVVEAVEKSPYAITTDGWMGEVTEVCNNAFMWVRPLNDEGESLEDEELGYFVKSCFFQNCDKKANSIDQLEFSKVLGW